jgi:hypothetical protein
MDGSVYPTSLSPTSLLAQRVHRGWPGILYYKNIFHGYFHPSGLYREEYCYAMSRRSPER